MSQRRQDGFTMIEMLLAMVFVAFLMITIAMTTIGMARTYQRGMTLAAVNSAGRAVTADIQRTITNSPAVNGDGKEVFTSKTISSSGGAICFGLYSYVWNVGSAINPARGVPPASLVKYKNGQVVRLAKVNDPSKAQCGNSAPAISLNATSAANSAAELLAADDAANSSYNGLALQSPLAVARGVSGAGSYIYQVSFSLGTNDPNALNLAQINTPTCQADNLDYCAINRFNFLVRAGGGTND